MTYTDILSDPLRDILVASVIIMIIFALIILSRPGKCKRCGKRKIRVYIPRSAFSDDLAGDFCDECDKEIIDYLHDL